MTDYSPLDSPEGDWWNREVNRRETMWLGISGVWALILFGWMIGWTQVGNQNQIGPTERVSPDAFQKKVDTYKKNAETTTIGGTEALVPASEDVYIGALQWAWDGLPVALETNQTYKFHLSAYDVQHGFSVRDEDNLSQQMSLQMLPGYEWIIEMSFDEPGTYHVVCNEFCGTGHRTMHGKIFVQEG
ncbi:MAG: cytochrome C oxidase subunit II [Halobacteriales archaeon]|nr:cytochrome C oxidase subunit II [Halobacteriales archaeon]